MTQNVDRQLEVMLEAFGEGSYHEAYRIWRELSALQDNQPIKLAWKELSTLQEVLPIDFKQVGQTIRKTAKTKTDALNAQLLQLLNSQTDLDELEIDELLEEWARADADDPRLPTNRILVQSRKRRQQEDHQYDFVLTFILHLKIK